MWPNPQFPADFITFIEDILNGKLHFLCTDAVSRWYLSVIRNQGNNFSLEIIRNIDIGFSFIRLTLASTIADFTIFYFDIFFA